MHRLEKKSNIVDSASEFSKLRFGVADEKSPICPKPRRVGSSLPEFLKPPKCSKQSQVKAEGRSEILNMIDGKSGDLREPTCNGCLTLCCYPGGSPPTRSDNPIVHDLEFIHQMELLSPLTRTKFSSDRLRFTSAPV